MASVVPQLTASNSSSGNLNFTTSGSLTLVPDGLGVAVSNTAANGFINIAALGAALTTNGLVEGPNGTSNQLQLQTPGLLQLE